MATGYAGPDDDEKGVPFRHARAKARLLVRGLRGEEARDVLETLIEKRPNDVLDAVCEYIDD